MRILVTLLATSFTASTIARAQTAPDSSTMDAILERLVAEHHVPGMSAVIVRSTGMVAAGAAGVRKLGSPDRITTDDQFHLGSNTKAMTATLAAMMVEQGNLTWKSRPTDVFPDLKDKIHPGYRDITLTDLLTHRAGIPPFTDDESAEFRELRASKVISGSAMEQRRALLYWVLQQKPYVPPGTKMEYSNAGYSLAAAMVEKVSEEAWEAAMTKRLFRPLGIHGGFGWPALSDPNQPWGHWQRPYQPHDPHGEYQLPDWLSPAGAAQMSMPDYGRFLRTQLEGIVGKDTLVKAGTIRLLHAPVGDYAFGWAIRTDAGLEVHGHAGSAGTFFLIAQIWPALDLAIAVATNAGDDVAEKACSDGVRLLKERVNAARVPNNR